MALYPLLYMVLCGTLLCKVKFSHTAYQALGGPELTPAYRQSAIYSALDCHYFPPGCGYLPSQCHCPSASTRLYCLVSGDRGTWVWTTCPRLLLNSAAAGTRTHYHWVTSLMPKPLDYRVTLLTLYRTANQILKNKTVTFTSIHATDLLVIQRNRKRLQESVGSKQ